MIYCKKTQENIMSVILGIDVGGSTTKIVGIKRDGEEYKRIEPQLVRANDPITAIA